jgi:hypothetical protein
VGKHYTIPMAVIGLLGAIAGAYIGFGIGGVGAAILGVIVVSASGAFLGLLVGGAIETSGDVWRHLSAKRFAGLPMVAGAVAVVLAIVLLWGVGR